MKLMIAGAVAASFLGWASQAGAVTYSAYGQFNIAEGAITATNFAYGWVNEGASIDTINAFTSFQTACNGDVNVQCATQGGLPGVFKADGAYDAPGTAFFDAGELNLHPGSAGEMPVIQFVAPTAGAYTFTGAFSANDTSPGGVDVFASIGGASQFPAGATSPRTFTFNADLAAGQRASFAIGRQGSYFFDSTGFSLTVSSADIATPGVPEPATWAMMIGGFGLAGAMIRRRRAVAAV